MNDTGKEIERAWVLNIDNERLNEISKRSIHHEQIDIGYIFSDEFGELRLASKESYPHNLLYLTVKSRGNLVRNEWEILIPSWVFDQLWQKTGNSRLTKTRYYFKDTQSGKDYVLELDKYKNHLTGLFRLECEFSSKEDSESFELPDVFKDCCVEITNNIAFKNKNLATNGLPNNWKEIFS